MEFSARTEPFGDGSCVIDLCGEVDLYTSSTFKTHVIDAVARGKRTIVVDLTDVTFIDSTALGVLMGAQRRLLPAGGRIAIVCKDRNIRKVFQVTGLDRVFGLYETRAAALANGKAAVSSLH
jgi:anti-sigma B factor antagonist